MAKSPKKKPKQREDLNQLAARIVAEATGVAAKTPHPDQGKNPAAVKRGKAGGKKGGKSRGQSLSATERSRIAQVAARARWARAES